jgi:hypothetical protein
MTAYAGHITALVSFCTLVVSALALYSAQKRASGAEVREIMQRITALESGMPSWHALEEIRRELREVHAHVENLDGELRTMRHNLDLILEHFVRDDADRR